MREIKFRVWEINQSKLYYFDNLRSSHDQYIAENFFFPLNDLETYFFILASL